MNRVTIINLAGRAFHVEDAGVAAIEAWLGDARTRLAGDPDRDELLADFERAIAEKCEVHVHGDRDVVSDGQVRTILDTLGTVEPADTTAEAVGPTTGEPGPRTEDWRSRRLYRLTGGDEMLAGVCAGIAAYFRMDVTVVRVLAVLLAFITSGVAVLVYIVLALIVPEADSPDKRAAARGYGETAQEMIRRARDGAGPAMESLGSLITKAWHVAAYLIRWLFLTAAWTVSALWAVQTSWLWINGGGIATAFDADAPTWVIGLWITSVAWLIVGFCLALAGAFGMASNRTTRPRHRSRGSETAIATFWSATMIAAAIGTFAIPVSWSEPIRDIAADGQGRIELFGETICIDDPSTDEAPTRAERCRPGDLRP